MVTCGWRGCRALGSTGYEASGICHYVNEHDRILLDHNDLKFNEAVLTEEENSPTHMEATRSKWKE